MGGHQSLWRNAQRIGAGDGVGFMVQHKIEDRGQNRAFANAFPQFFGGNARERQ